MSNTNPAYSTTQQQLYLVTEMAWGNYKDNLADFAAFKGKYTAQLATDALAEVAAAKAIPDNQTRGAVPETMRLQLLPLAEVCLFNFQKLKSYIEEVYEDGEEKPMLDAAGSQYYRAASREGWEQMGSLLTASAKFLTDHATTLEAGGQNMPTAFVAEYNTAKTAFETKYSEFLKTAQATPAGTSTKITANNALYKKVIAMLNDGQLLYKNNPTKKDLFTFSSLLSYITTAGTTGIEIKLTDKQSSQPIGGYTATLQPGNKTGIADATGILQLTIAEGLYDMTITATGYPAYTEKDIKITTGVMSKKGIVLEK